MHHMKQSSKESHKLIFKEEHNEIILRVSIQIADFSKSLNTDS